jgi:hypothetical protein
MECKIRIADAIVYTIDASAEFRTDDETWRKKRGERKRKGREGERQRERGRAGERGAERGRTETARQRDRETVDERGTAVRTNRPCLH